MKKLVPECLDMCDTTMIQQFFCKTWRYMDAYWYIPYLIHSHCWWTPCDSKGLSPQQTAFAIKCYQLYCHVGLPGDIWVLMAAQEASLKVRKAAWAPPLSPRTSTTWCAILLLLCFKFDIKIIIYSFLIILTSLPFSLYLIQLTAPIWREFWYKLSQ